MDTLINILTFLLVAALMVVFYGIVAAVLGALWGFNVSLALALRVGITAYVLSIVAPMIFAPASYGE